MSIIRPEMSIAEILETYPETLSVFTAHGFESFADPEVQRVLAPFLRLKTALRTRGVNTELFVKILEEHIREVRSLREDTLASLETGQGELTLLALMPCGLKMPFTRAMENAAAGIAAQAGHPLRYIVEGNLNQELSYYPYVNQVQSVDELPDIVVSADINSFYYRTFRERFLEPGHFVDATALNANASFRSVRIQDPEGRYTMLAVNPLVVVVDRKRLAGRPLPRRWADLLHPRWRRDITMRGDGQFFCHAVLLPFYQDQGPLAVADLGRNVRTGCHPAQMVKEAGNGREEGAALYIMPDFFARKIVRKDAVEIIWPEDGAVVSPVTMLVKRDKAAALAPIIDYLAGEEMARIFAGAYFPAVHPQVENLHPPEARFKWLGWDFIAAHDIEAVNAEIDRSFLPAYREGRA